MGGAADGASARDRQQALHQRLRAGGDAGAGSLVTVEITEARDYDLVGRVLDTQAEAAPVSVQGNAPPALVQIHAAR